MAILFPINSILKSNNFNKEVIVQGWVKTFRSNRFINLNDGSCIEDLQCVLDFENTEKNILDKEYTSNGYFYTYDDDWSNPGSITTIEGVGYYPQAGFHFLAGMTIRF